MTINTNKAQANSVSASTSKVTASRPEKCYGYDRELVEGLIDAAILKDAEQFESLGLTQYRRGGLSYNFVAGLNAHIFYK